jgi:hypothetical protein
MMWLFSIPSIRLFSSDSRLFVWNVFVGRHTVPGTIVTVLHYPSGSIVLAIWNSIRLTKPRLKGRPARNAKSSPAPGNVYTAGQMHNARVETPKKAFLFVVSDCDLAPRFYLLGRWRMHGIFGSLARKR